MCILNLFPPNLRRKKGTCDGKPIIFTHDADFLHLAHDWAQQGKEHGGIIDVHQYKHSIGECIRRLMGYALILEADDMKNRVEFL
ncbi:MAG: hypothetical protein NZT92_11280 [Abditibacteriales bacterium]|nr:hypothetical protein [Abditibacteriales bacterium]MDW8367273.1 hypothetical protein [Abditibacteriales bacterium]